MTLFILDSGNLDEYKRISEILRTYGHELWGGTTNPTLIAKEFQGQKVTQQEAFAKQKEIVLKLLKEVDGGVSAEVYADLTTKADQMIEQGREIASWDKSIVVKLPTNLEGFKARSVLRREGIITNNTLVFSQQQICAICLHEKLLLQEAPRNPEVWPPFISPFVGRLDDIGQNGIDLVAQGMQIKEQVGVDVWMLEASVRTPYHLKRGIELKSELITAPAKVYEEWFNLSIPQQQAIGGRTDLQAIPTWEIPQELLAIKSSDELIAAMASGQLDISHPLTDKGIAKFAEDWKNILLH